jgi:flavin-dependent dehydrogenase
LPKKNLTRKDFEIGIIGGGPAGASLANYLAGNNFDVCLAEKKSFPRETLCGEFLSFEVTESLRELNLVNDFTAAEPNPIKYFRFYNTSGEDISAELKFPAFGLRRSVFDNILLSGAKNKGIQVFQPAEVKEIKRINNSFQLLIHSEGSEFYLNVRFLISAYGKQNPLDNFLGRSFIKKKSRLNGVKFHLHKNLINNFDHSEIRIYSADNIYCGVNAVDNDTVTFCFLEKREGGQPSARRQLPELRKKNPAFDSLLKNFDNNEFSNLPIYGTGNIYFGRRDIIEDGIFMIGDSAGVIAPLAGNGIGIAFESARMLSNILIRNRNKPIEKIETIYKMEWENCFLRRLKTALFIQTFVLNRTLRKTGFIAAGIFPGILSHLIRTTRKIK